MTSLVHRKEVLITNYIPHQAHKSQQKSYAFSGKIAFDQNTRISTFDKIDLIYFIADLCSEYQQYEQATNEDNDEEVEIVDYGDLISEGKSAYDEAI